MVECEFCEEEFEDERELHAHWREHEDELNSHQKEEMKKAERKKEEEKDRKRKKRKQYMIYGSAGVLALGLAAVIVPQFMPESGSTGEFNITTEGQPVIGSDNASVTVVEFGDYSCPACRTFEMETYPQLKQNYIDTGEVRFSFINLAFLGPDSQEAAVAGECVYRQNETEFWEYHKSIYDNQGSEQGWATQELLMNLARENTEGLDYQQLNSCISSGDTTDQVRTERGIANSNGVSSTPTVFVNGDKVNGNSYAAIKTAIDSELQN